MRPPWWPPSVCLWAQRPPDAKGALAHATLAQIGLILAEISLGLTTLALAHLVCHALLRSWQFLRAPNMIHDAHANRHHGTASIPAGGSAITAADRLFAMALHRLRLDERIDAATAPVVALAGRLSTLELHVRRLLSIGAERR
jgi:Proton-conducting membrane transporter